jgi:hypothetical protein
MPAHGTPRHFGATRNLVIIDAQRTSIQPYQTRFMNTHPSAEWRKSSIGLAEIGHPSEIVSL